MTESTDTLKRDALDYHRSPRPGKISVTPTKAMTTQRDLALAYSPGVAEACMAIVGGGSDAARQTVRHQGRITCAGRSKSTLRSHAT